MAEIYKICTTADWDAAAATGRYEGSADDRRDGFIHLSARDQLEGTLARHFGGAMDLVLIAFDASDLPNVKWEPSRGGALFPHVYGVLPTDKALWSAAITLRDGCHILPERLRA